MWDTETRPQLETWVLLSGAANTEEVTAGPARVWSALKILDTRECHHRTPLVSARAHRVLGTSRYWGFSVHIERTHEKSKV